MKKKLFSLLMVIVLIVSMVTSVNAKSKKDSKPGKVNPLSIHYTDTITDWRTYINGVFKWDKVKGAKGYQIRLIDEAAYSNGNLTILNSEITTTNKITMEIPTQDICDQYRIQIRAYKTSKGGNKIFGKWSTDLFAYLTYALFEY